MTASEEAWVLLLALQLIVSRVIGQVGIGTMMPSRRGVSARQNALLESLQV